MRRWAPRRAWWSPVCLMRWSTVDCSWWPWVWLAQCPRIAVVRCGGRPDSGWLAPRRRPATQHDPTQHDPTAAGPCGAAPPAWVAWCVRADGSSVVSLGRLLCGREASGRVRGGTRRCPGGSASRRDGPADRGPASRRTPPGIPHAGRGEPATPGCVATSAAAGEWRSGLQHEIWCPHPIISPRTPFVQAIGEPLFPDPARDFGHVRPQWTDSEVEVLRSWIAQLAGSPGGA
jgi:hypothetical protein